MKLCKKRRVSKIRLNLGPFQILFGGDPGSLVRQRSKKKSQRQRQLDSASRSSPSLEVLQVARMCQAGTVDFLS